MWFHVFFDCEIVHFSYNWMLPDKWYTTIENNKKLIKLKHLSTYYGTSMARLLDSKIFDNKLETLVLSLDKGFEIEALINYLNRQNH